MISSAIKKKIEIGCTSNKDCPAQKSCINTVCTDPCSLANPCGPQQECKVIEHQPVCSRVCECQHKRDCREGFTCDGCQCQQEGKRTKTKINFQQLFIG